MKVGIFGYGFVGQALAGICKDEPAIYDPKFKDSYGSAYKVDMKKNDINFICVGTPSEEDDDGKIDDAALMETLEYLDDLKYTGLVVIKSTIIYGYISEFLSKSKLRVVVNPEFLSQITSFEDAQKQTRILIGCDNILDAKILKQFYLEETMLPNTWELEFDICSTKEACDFKYIRNIYGAMLVTFWEMVHETTDDNSRKMAALLEKYPLPSKMNRVGMDGERGFGGACFPKDAAAWGHFHSDDFVNMLVSYNKVIRGESNE